MKAKSSALFAAKQFIRPNRSKDDDRGSKWIGGECNGFQSGTRGASNIVSTRIVDDMFVATFC